MRTALVDILACPRDQTFPLRLDITETGPDGEVETGSVLCPQCGHRYPIRAGIPDLLYLGQDDKTDTKNAEIEARDAEVTQYETSWTEYENLAESRAILQCAGLSGNEQILELGCGTGRISRLLAPRCQRFVGIDFSLGFLQTCQKKIEGRPNCDLIRADLNHLPLRPQALFDVITSAQVFEHLPSVQLRQHFLRQSRDLLHRDGRLVLTTYNFSFAKRYKKEPKEGFHRSGIYYYSYEAEEFREELERLFTIEEMAGVRSLPLWLSRCVGPRLGGRVDWTIRKTRLGLFLGNLLCVVGRCPTLDASSEPQEERLSTLASVGREPC